MSDDEKYCNCYANEFGEKIAFCICNYKKYENKYFCIRCKKEVNFLGSVEDFEKYVISSFTITSHEAKYLIRAMHIEQHNAYSVDITAGLPSTVINHLMSERAGFVKKIEDKLFKIIERGFSF